MQPAPSRRSGSIRPAALGGFLTLLILAAGLLAWAFLRLPPPTSVPDLEVVRPAEWSRTNLLLLEGRLHEPGQETVFNGLMVDHYPDGTIRSRSAVTNGLLHGLSQGWYTNGQMQVLEQFHEGVSHGLRTKWYPSGTKQSEASIVAGKLEGPFRRWHENGTLSEEATFLADQPEGVSLAYYPSGFLKARVVMKAGQAVEQTFWKDGEKKP